MRDAFGGTFMIKVFLVFIAIYIGFTAVALNYAKAFKVKNKVIEYLESSEITNLNKLDASTKTAMEDFIEKELLGNMNYNVSGLDICSRIQTKDYSGRTVAYCHESGIVIKEQASATNTEGVYYKVQTYLGWSIPFLNSLLSLNGNNQSQDVPMGVWEISGETRLIVNQ